MKRALTWATAVGVLVVSWLVVSLQPGEQLTQGPFVVNVSLNEQGTGRNIEATINDVLLAQVVQVDQFEGVSATTQGTWLVADITAFNLITPRALTSFLLVGDDEFRGSQRLGNDALESRVLVVGIPTSGVVLFEIPRETAATATSATIVIGLSSDWRLDSVIATTIDLTALSTEPLALVAPTERVAP